MNLSRSSGILLHLSSLPGPYGIGDMGQAFPFIDFLQKAGQSCWQILPLTPTLPEYGNSPYSGPSAFAGNLIFISPEMLVEDGLLEQKDLRKLPRFRKGQADYRGAAKLKENLLARAFERFRLNDQLRSEFEAFTGENAWLEDYALYSVLKEKQQHKGWTQWPADWRNHKPHVVAEIRKEIAPELEAVRFRQFVFFRQWSQVREYADERGIKIIGDLPFYVNHDSADCWAHSRYFKLDSHGQPTFVSGVPPDYFSETGQLWGTPVYDWSEMEKENFEWWTKRLEQNLKLYDIVRIDHFRALSTYWEVPAGEDTAINGKWVKAPGYAFFDALRKHFPQMPFIAEDLGDLDDEVHRLRHYSGLPGMRVLQFAFGDSSFQSPDLPHNHIPNSIAYTGTHDNNTSRGWYKKASKDEKQRLTEYLECSPGSGSVSEILIKTNFRSVARVAIVPAQDVLALGEKAMMNRPGTAEGNWVWRLDSLKSINKKAKFLRRTSQIYGRESKSSK